MTKSFCRLTERYCPVLGRNVAVQTQYRESGKEKVCLYSWQCRQEKERCLIRREKESS